MYYSHLTSFDAAIAHARTHGEIDVPGIRHGALEYIEQKKGDRDACLIQLTSLHQARSIFYWFSEKKLLIFKKNAYVAAKLNYIRLKESGQGMTLEQEYLPALFSDHEALLDWFMHLEPGTPSGLKLINNPKDAYFRHFQMTLALRGSWSRLAERAELFLQEIPEKMKAYAADQRFYLALTKGDLVAMREALTELTSPRINSVRRKKLDFAYSDPFVVTLATMYAKIAWRHGFQIEVDTPLIPKEWLPVVALDSYEDPYPFMHEYETSTAIPV